MILFLSFQSESDREKFEHIYYTYNKLFLYKANAILHDGRLAEDAVSEAFLRIYKHLAQVQMPVDGRSMAFMMTIVKNVCFTMRQKELKRPAAQQHLEETLEDGFQLESHIIAQLSAEEILRLVDELQEDMKSVFLLKCAYGFSHKKIGEVLHITENNVTVKWHRARKKMKEILIREGYAYEKRPS